MCMMQVPSLHYICIVYTCSIEWLAKAMPAAHTRCQCQVLTQKQKGLAAGGTEQTEHWHVFAVLTHQHAH